MSANKTLVLLGVYVEDAVATARDYEERLSMRRIAEHFIRTESATSECIIMAGSDEPPWVVIFSGQGKESIAARIVAERGVGLHRLVYLTAEYDRDLAWLRGRNLGRDGLVTLADQSSLRRVSAPLSELGVIVDLVEKPGTEHWLMPLLRSLGCDAHYG
ncbi:hypothetical protein [Pendulispora albinea]|uniref:Uncharacterized protein n=1 Tax=Pendulispora albinea TaxID=2741071 RepID=A0ABZ2M1L0_9BACT